MDIFVNNSGQLNKLLEQAQGISPMADVSFPLVTSQAETALHGSIIYNQLLRARATGSGGGVSFVGNADNSITVNGTAINNQNITLTAAAIQLTVNHLYINFGFYQDPNWSTLTGISLGGLAKDNGEGTLWYNTGFTSLNARLEVKTGDKFTNTVIFPKFMDVNITFGDVVAKYLYDLEVATPGAGVKWFRDLFPLDEYPYDTGTVKPFNQTLFFNI